MKFREVWIWHIPLLKVWINGKLLNPNRENVQKAPHDLKGRCKSFKTIITKEHSLYAILNYNKQYMYTNIILSKFPIQHNHWTTMKKNDAWLTLVIIGILFAHKEIWHVPHECTTTFVTNITILFGFYDWAFFLNEHQDWNKRLLIPAPSEWVCRLARQCHGCWVQLSWTTHEVGAKINQTLPTP
jgi:hypothetical protein